MNHLEFAAAESASLTPTGWERWAYRVEAGLGHDLDGDRATDGYSIDMAYDLYKKGHTVAQAVRTINMCKADRA